MKVRVRRNEERRSTELYTEIIEQELLRGIDENDGEEIVALFRDVLIKTSIATIDQQIMPIVEIQVASLFQTLNGRGYHHETKSASDAHANHQANSVVLLPRAQTQDPR